jgi:ABC-type amino acid transport substrate-binding protein
LLDSLEISSDLFQLYIVSSLFTSRFTSLLAAMNIFVLAVGGTAMLAGIARISMKRLILYSALTPVVLGTALVGTALLLDRVVNTDYTMNEVVARMTASSELPEEIRSYHWDGNAGAIEPRTIAQIKESGILRIGYNPIQLPFSYVNSTGKLVGFDIELMERLAFELEVDIAYIPYSIGGAVSAIDAGQFDIGVSGLQMTTHRLQRLAFTDPVLTLHYALVVKDHRAEELNDEDNLRKIELSIASVGGYSILPELEKKFPNWQFDRTDSDQAFFDDNGETWDALLTSLEAGKTWTILYPGYTTLYNRDEIRSFPASYIVALGNDSLLTFMNSWLELQHSSGYTDKLYNYWILGENAKPRTARWSVIKDVLHLVDE